MNILLTNDDGIQSEGIWRLADVIRDLGSTVVVAPDRDQSGIGTAKSLQGPVSTHEFRSHLPDVQAIMVEGTPADCVILATESLGLGRFDLVISGINTGANLGLDIMSSGTVGAALQGYFRNIPSIAVSVTSLTNVRFDAATKATTILADAVLKRHSNISLPLLLNMNVPNIRVDRIAGSEITTLGPRVYMENVESEQRNAQTQYRIQHNKLVGREFPVGSDVATIQQNKVSITPLDGLLMGIDGQTMTREFAAIVGQSFCLKK